MTTTCASASAGASAPRRCGTRRRRARCGARLQPMHRIAVGRQPARRRSGPSRRGRAPAPAIRRRAAAAAAASSPSLLGARIDEEIALQREHRPQRGLGHRRVHRRVDHARERHVGRQRRRRRAGGRRRPTATGSGAAPASPAALPGGGIGDDRDLDLRGSAAALRSRQQPLRSGSAARSAARQSAQLVGVEVAAQQDRVHAACRDAGAAALDRRHSAASARVDRLRADRRAVAGELQQLGTAARRRAAPAPARPCRPACPAPRRPARRCR